MLALAPDFLVKKTAHDVFSRHTMVFSNLPGPTEDLVFCGETVTGMQIIFPNLIPQVGIHMNLTFCACVDTAPFIYRV